MENWKVKISERFGYIGLSIFIYREIGDEKTEVMKGGDLVKTYERGEAIEPTIYIPNREILSELQAELTRYGIKSPEKSFIEGENSAMKEHLGDMRRLVFEEEKIVKGSPVKSTFPNLDDDDKN